MFDLILQIDLTLQIPGSSIHVLHQRKVSSGSLYVLYDVFFKIHEIHHL